MREFFKKNALILGILFLAIVFRFLFLNSMPPGLYPDVAVNGTDAIRVLETGKWQIYYPNNNGREGFFINLIVLSFKVFGVGVWQLRVVGAMIGVLTVLGLYFLTKKLFGKKIALFSSFFLTTSFWRVNFSRIGLRAIMVPFILVWGFYFLIKAFESKKWLDWMTPAVFFGLGFYTYIAYKIAPLIIGLVLIVKSFTEKDFFKISWKKILFFSTVVVLIYIPLFLLLKNNPDLASRTSQISIFNPDVNKGNLIETAVKTTTLGLGMYNFWGDPNWRHNIPHLPALNVIVGIFFLVGIFIGLKKIIKHWKDSFGFFCLFVSFGAMLLPAILTEEGMPHSLRAIGTIPFVFMLVGIGAEFVFRKLFPLASKKILVFVLGLIILMDGLLYFIFWAKNPQTIGAFNQNYVNIGQYFNSLNPSVKKIVVANRSAVEVDGLPVDVQTIKFTTYKKANIDYLLPEEVFKNHYLSKTEFVFLIPDEKLFAAFQRKYPQGKLKKIDLRPNTNSDFYLYQL